MAEEEIYEEVDISPPRELVRARNKPKKSHNYAGGAFSKNIIEYTNEKNAIWTFIEQPPHNDQIVIASTRDGRKYYTVCDRSKISSQEKHLRYIYKYDGKPINPVDAWLLHPKCNKAKFLEFIPGVTTERMPEVFSHYVPSYYPEHNYGEDLLQPMLSHLHFIAAKGNEEIYQYILKWLAFIIQNPTKRTHKALCLVGLPGTGKGLIANHFSKLFEPHTVALTAMSDVLERFNELVEDKILVTCDNVGRLPPKFNDKFKTYITQPTITLEGKGRSSKPMLNYANYLLCSNSRDDFMRLEVGNRHQAIFEVSDTYAEANHAPRRTAYMNRLVNDAENFEVLCTWHYYLKHKIQVTASDLEYIPQTEARIRIQGNSQDSVAEWLEELLREGILPSSSYELDFVGDWPTERSLFPVQELYDAYFRYFQMYERRFQENREPAPVTLTKFSQEMKKYNSWIGNTGGNAGNKKTFYPKHGGKGAQLRCYLIPPLAVYRVMFAEATQRPIHLIFPEDAE